MHIQLNSLCISSFHIKVQRTCSSIDSLLDTSTKLPYMVYLLIAQLSYYSTILPEKNNVIYEQNTNYCMLSFKLPLMSRMPTSMLVQKCTNCTCPMAVSTQSLNQMQDNVFTSSAIVHTHKRCLTALIIVFQMTEFVLYTVQGTMSYRKYHLVNMGEVITPYSQLYCILTLGRQ